MIEKYLKNLILPSLVIIILILISGNVCFSGKTDTNKISELRNIIWAQDESKETRIKAISDIFKINPEMAFNELKNLVLSDEEDEIRYIATVFLGMYEPSKISKLMISLLDDKSSKIRRDAAYIIGVHRIEEAFPKLIEHLSDESSLVKYASIEALGNIGNKEALRHLVTILEGSDSIAKSSVIPSLQLILCQNNDDQRWIIDKIIDRLNDYNKNVRAKACYAIYDIFGNQLNCSNELNNTEIIKTIIKLKGILWSKKDLKLKSCKKMIKQYDESRKKIE